MRQVIHSKQVEHGPVTVGQPVEDCQQFLLHGSVVRCFLRIEVDFIQFELVFNQLEPVILLDVCQRRVDGDGFDPGPDELAGLELFPVQVYFDEAFLQNVLRIVSAAGVAQANTEHTGGVRLIYQVVSFFFSGPEFL